MTQDEAEKLIFLLQEEKKNLAGRIKVCPARLDETKEHQLIIINQNQSVIVVAVADITTPFDYQLGFMADRIKIIDA